MKISTSRFGEVEVGPGEEVHFPEGILGFNNLRKFVLLEDPTDEIFAWLQSCESGETAFPVLEPELFNAQNLIKLTKHDLEALGVKSTEGLRFFTIVTIPEDPTLMTANLKAPIVINVKDRQARQCVLQDNDLAIREPIFLKLQQRLIHAPSPTMKDRAAQWGVVIRLPEIAPAKDLE